MLWETSYPLVQGNQGAFCLIREGLSGSEKGAGGFGKDGVAFRDKGVANFRGRGERAEVEKQVQQLGQMVVRDQ